MKSNNVFFQKNSKLVTDTLNKILIEKQLSPPQHMIFEHYILIKTLNSVIDFPFKSRTQN